MDPRPEEVGAPGHTRNDRGNLVAGFVVVGVGLFLLLAQVVPDMGRWIVLLIGLVFLVAALVRREYGLLVPGSILGGIGVGVVLSGWLDDELSGPAIVLSLAAGFAGIWVIGGLTGMTPRREPADRAGSDAGSWWPLIPAGIIGLVGLIALTDVDAGGLGRWWPLLIIALGLLILMRHWARQRGSG